MKAIIFKPTKTAMQSGYAKTKSWILEFERQEKVNQDKLIGWNSSGDTSSFIKLSFSTKEKAVKYAKENNLEFIIQEPNSKKTPKRSYSDNFK